MRCQYLFVWNFLYEVENKRIIKFSVLFYLILTRIVLSVPQPYTIKKVQAQIHDNADLKEKLTLKEKWLERLYGLRAIQ
jgi:hypothetical protein